MNGGLISVRTTPPPILSSESKIIEALVQNRDGETFLNDLCLFSLNKLGSHLNVLEKILVNVLREKAEEADKNHKTSASKKTQKKKSKKKQQK